MGKIKILKNNKKSKFMIISLIIFSFSYALFGILMLISPAVANNETTSGFEIINSIYTDPSYLGLGFEYKKVISFVDFFLFEKSTGKFIIAPTSTTMIYGPIILGSLICTVMIIRIIIHSVGYKNKTKKGIARIVRPIKSYQFTMILAWISFAVLTIAALVSFFAASPYQMGVVWEFSIKGSVTTCAQEVLEHINETFTNKKQFYWPTMAWFYDGYIMTSGNKVWLKWLWVLIPTTVFIPLLLVAFIGTICGECSWWTINLAVLRDIDAATGTNLATEYDHVEAPSVKKAKKGKEAVISKPEIQSPVEIKNKEHERIINFHKSIVKLFEMAKNTDIQLYKNSKLELNRLETKTENIDWDQLAQQVEEKFENFTRTDQKFVNLVSNIIENSHLNVFGRYKEDIQTLIEEYRHNIEEWDAYEAETIVEQIFTIASRREELLAKVGFCLKERLKNNFSHIEANDNIIERLNRAKEDEDYTSYRELCLDTIAKMSPIKAKIASYADKIIYN